MKTKIFLYKIRTIFLLFAWHTYKPLSRPGKVKGYCMINMRKTLYTLGQQHTYEKRIMLFLPL